MLWPVNKIFSAHMISSWNKNWIGIWKCFSNDRTENLPQKVLGKVKQESVQNFLRPIKTNAN